MLTYQSDHTDAKKALYCYHKMYNEIEKLPPFSAVKQFKRDKDSLKKRKDSPSTRNLQGLKKIIKWQEVTSKR